MLLTTTLPLGLYTWVAYLGSFRTLADTVAVHIPMWKQQTIYAFWRTAIGTSGSPLVPALWAFAALPLGATAAIAWLKTPLDSRFLPRLFGLTVLTLVCCNTYLFLYDGLLLALPGMVWYITRQLPLPRIPPNRWCPLSFIYGWQHLTTWVLHGGWALVGPAAGVWLIADAWRFLIGRKIGP